MKCEDSTQRAFEEDSTKAHQSPLLCQHSIMTPFWEVHSGNLAALLATTADLLLKWVHGDHGKHLSDEKMESKTVGVYQNEQSGCSSIVKNDAIAIREKNKNQELTNTSLESRLDVVKNLFIVIVFFAFCSYFNSLCQILVQKIADEKFGRNSNVEGVSMNRDVKVIGQLPDIGFMILPFVPSHAYCDVLLIIMYIVTFFRMMALGPRLATIVKRVCFLHSFLFVLRGISFTVTVLPNPFPNCKSRLHPNPFISAVLILTGANNTCADVFFSGHAVGITLLWLVWSYYTNNKKINAYFVAPISIFALLSLVATRFHYTSDVIYGCGLSFACWYWYHMVILPHYKGTETGENKTSYIKRIFYWMVDRVECDCNMLEDYTMKLNWQATMKVWIDGCTQLVFSWKSFY